HPGTRTWGDLARPNGLGQHLVAAPARVHDPETFDDGTTGDSTFTLHAEGDDANGHFILDESGSTHTVWNEWGDDTSDHWTFDETGSFTATFHYVGEEPTTTTIPIDVHQSSDADTAPAGFDLDAYNQTLFYSPDSITVWDIDADGSETYHAHVQGTITDDQGDAFTFTLNDNGGDNFSEDDGGTDTMSSEPGASAPGVSETGTFDDSDGGNETSTITITGTLAGGLTVNFSDTVTSNYHDEDDGSFSEDDDSDSGTDHFDNSDSGSDNPSLTITGPISGDGFSGTITYTDIVSNSGFSSHDWGSVTDDGDDDPNDGDDDSADDHFDDEDHGSHATTLTVSGSVSDAETGFSGTINYTDRANGNYRDHDVGFEDEDGDGT